MKKRQIFTVSIPSVSHEFAAHLDKTFPKVEIKPGVDRDRLMESAGERKVVEYILRASTGTSILGNEQDINTNNNTSLKQYSLLDKLLGRK